MIPRVGSAGELWHPHPRPDSQDPAARSHEHDGELVLTVEALPDEALVLRLVGLLWRKRVRIVRMWMRPISPDRRQVEFSVSMRPGALGHLKEELAAIVPVVSVEVS
jgi:hypothetical protein